MKIKSILILAIILIVGIGITSFIISPKMNATLKQVPSDETSEKQYSDKEFSFREIRKNKDENFEFKQVFKWVPYKELVDDNTIPVLSIKPAVKYHFVVFNNDQRMGTASLITIGFDNSISFDKTFPNLNGNIKIIAERTK